MMGFKLGVATKCSSVAVMHIRLREYSVRVYNLSPTKCVSSVLVVAVRDCSCRQRPSHRLTALQAKWLLGLLRQDEAAAAAALRLVPQSVVKDMASWLSFCIRMGRAGAGHGDCGVNAGMGGLLPVAEDGPLLSADRTMHRQTYAMHVSHVT